ncbi:hypothetical protein KRR26_24900 [Corallococcus sp. M34]|uniref:hypothetical protein n=1 Tax=Citreicoccus inhibens TaxID=2849499 RepID=UPI0013155096|nr:hypothetical protein [Citreicoccus inhibens]MBU8898854.1 hypothetical protein [Citreicoccus inhibens]
MVPARAARGKAVRGRTRPRRGLEPPAPLPRRQEAPPAVEDVDVALDFDEAIASW